MEFSISGASEKVSVLNNENSEPSRAHQEEPRAYQKESRANETAQANHPTALVEKQTVNYGDLRRISLQRHMDSTQYSQPTAISEPAAISIPSATPSSETPKTVTPETVKEANKYHIVQFANGEFNPNGPLGSKDGGPASLEMALQAAGIKTNVDKSQNNVRIFESRKDMGKHNAGKTQSNQSVTNTLNVVKGANAAIERARVNGILGADEGSAQITNNGTWDSFDTALDNGKTVVLSGDITSKYREINGFINDGAKKNYGRGGSGHFVAVVGRAANGNYIVSDPMSMNGAKEMTKEQLATFTQTPADYVAISGKFSRSADQPASVEPITSANVAYSNDFNAQQIADIINTKASKESPLRDTTAERLAAHIIAESERTGVPAWLTVAQMRFESSFGNLKEGLNRKRTVYNANGKAMREDSARNLFGLTGKNKTTGEFVKVGESGRHFRSYNSWEASVTDYVNSVSKHYSGLNLRNFLDKYSPISDGNNRQTRAGYVETIQAYASQNGINLTHNLTDKTPIIR